MAKLKPSCNCRSQIQKELAKRNVSLEYDIFNGDTSYFIEVNWKDADKRKRGQRLPKVLATHCPFCGVKLPDRESPISS